MTGPAIDGDPNRDTRVVVREVFESARRSVLIVGYAFYGSDKIFEPLARRMGEDPALTARIVVNIHPRGRRLDRPDHPAICRRLPEDELALPSQAGDLLPAGVPGGPGAEGQRPRQADRGR